MNRAHQPGRTGSENGLYRVAIVGAGMKGIPGISAKVFNALGECGINVITIAMGSSEYNLSIVVDEKDADAAVRAIHAGFGLNDSGT